MINVKYKKNGAWEFVIDYENIYGTKIHSKGYEKKKYAQKAANEIIKHLRHLDKINVKR